MQGLAKDLAASEEIRKAYLEVNPKEVGKKC